MATLVPDHSRHSKGVREDEQFSLEEQCGFFNHTVFTVIILCRYLDKPPRLLMSRLDRRATPPLPIIPLLEEGRKRVRGMTRYTAPWNDTTCVDLRNLGDSESGHELGKIEQSS
jgi:hypothetical protein